MKSNKNNNYVDIIFNLLISIWTSIKHTSLLKLVQDIINFSYPNIQEKYIVNYN